MGNPTRSDYYVSKPLTSILVAYFMDEAQYWAHKTFPVVKSDPPGGFYYKYTREDWMRIVARRRAPGTESAGGGFKLGKGTYSTEVRAVHFDVTDQDRAIAGTFGFSLDSDATRWVGGQLLLERESEWVDNYFKPTVWGTDLQGVTGVPAGGQFKQWDQAGSTPIEDIQTQGIIMAERTTKRPNRLTISPYVWLKLSNHDEIIERVKFTQKGFIGLDLLATAFNVDEVAVTYGTANVTVEGTANSNSTFLAGKHALLSYAPKQPSRLEPSAGYTFTWNGYLGAEAMGARISKFRMEQLKSDRVEGEQAYSMHVVAPDVGVFFKDAVG